MRMSTATVDIRATADLEDLLAPGERLLWLGSPAYGHGFFQAVGAERVWRTGLAIGALAIWGSYPFLNLDSTNSPNAALWVYSAATLALAYLAAVMATQRQNVMCNLAYLVTDRRAILCRKGRTWRLGERMYVISVPHSETYPYRLHPSRPYPSLQIGDLLSQEQVQPLGIGLAHPGQPYLWGRNSAPIAFEFIPDAPEVLNLIHAQTRDDAAGTTAPV